MSTKPKRSGKRSDAGAVPVLREEGTERRFTSALNTEYRKGVFVAQVAENRCSSPT
jgi:peptide methionine sulfoxide reductase MsrB